MRFEVQLVIKSSQTLFVVLPGPAGCACVAVETWPSFLARQFSLVCFSLTPQPWVEQKSSQCQLLKIAASSWLVQRLDSDVVTEGVESVAAVAAYELEMEAVFERGEEDFYFRVLRCCGCVQLVEGRATVCGGDSKVVEVNIELVHVIRRGRSLASGGMGGQRRGDSVGSH